MINLKDVSKKYDRDFALKNVNLNIKKVARINESEKVVYQKLTTLKTDVVLIDFTLQEIFSNI